MNESLPQGLWNCQRLPELRQDHEIVKILFTNLHRNSACVWRVQSRAHVLTWNVMPLSPWLLRCKPGALRLVFFLAAAVSVAAWPQAAAAQRERGELRIEVKDPQGRAAAAEAQLVSASNQLKRDFPIPSEGKYVAAELPFGVYRLTVAAEGFAEW